MKTFIIPASIAATLTPPPPAPRRGKSASKRQAEVAQRIVKQGGKRTSIAYTAQGLADIRTIMSREGLETGQDAVHAALRAYAQQK